MPEPKKSTLIPIFNRIFSKYPENTFTDLVEMSYIYKRLIDPPENDKYYNELTDPEHIGATPVYSCPIVMFSSYKEDYKVFKTILNVLVI